MKQNKSHISKIIIILFIIQIGCNKDNKIVTSENKYGIISISHTAMRIDPMIFSGIIRKLERGATVEIIKKSEEKTWVGKDNDFWYKVKTKFGRWRDTRNGRFTKAPENYQE